MNGVVKIINRANNSSRVNNSKNRENYREK